MLAVHNFCVLPLFRLTRNQGVILIRLVCSQNFDSPSNKYVWDKSLFQDAFAWEEVKQAKLCWKNAFCNPELFVERGLCQSNYQRHATLLVYLNDVARGGATRPGEFHPFGKADMHRCKAPAFFTTCRNKERERGQIILCTRHIKANVCMQRLHYHTEEPPSIYLGTLGHCYKLAGGMSWIW